MSEPMKDAWNEVAEGFARLGNVMKDRYRTGAEDSQAGAAQTAAEGVEQLREALERLVASGRDVGQRSIDVLRDADVNAQARDAANALNDALSATVDMIGTQVGQWFGRGQPTSATVADDDPEVAARIDQQMEDAEGGVEASTLDAPDDDAPPP